MTSSKNSIVKTKTAAASRPSEVLYEGIIRNIIMCI